MFKKSLLFFLVCLTVVIAGFIANADAAKTVAINLVAVNASADETKQSPIKYYLPRELTVEDIINTAGLNLDYDIDKSSYYLHGSVELKPKESRTIKIEVKDVWQISDEEVSILQKQIDENLSLLQGTQYYESAKLLRDRMTEKLDHVLAQQKSYSDNVERRIEEYRADAESVNQIRKNAFSVEYLKTKPTEESQGQTVKFIVEVKNSSAKEPKTFKQQHYLPAEVREEDVVDAQGFDVRFDDKKQQAYLTKEEEFKPGESKRYEIAIKDIWHISEENVESLKKRAETAFEGVKDSDFANSAKYILDGLMDDLQKIEDTQKSKDDMKKYIGAYRINKKRYDEAQESIIKLEMILATVKAKKLEEFEKSKVKNVLQKLKALRGIMAISQAVFGKKPSMNTTWKVIWGILVFVAFFTTIHFFTWWRKSQIMGEELALKAGGAIKEVTKAAEKEEEK